MKFWILLLLVVRSLAQAPPTAEAAATPTQITVPMSSQAPTIPSAMALPLRITNPKTIRNMPPIVSATNSVVDSTPTINNITSPSTGSSESANPLINVAWLALLPVAGLVGGFIFVYHRRKRQRSQENDSSVKASKPDKNFGVASNSEWLQTANSVSQNDSLPSPQREPDSVIIQIPAFERKHNHLQFNQTAENPSLITPLNGFQEMGLAQSCSNDRVWPYSLPPNEPPPSCPAIPKIAVYGDSASQSPQADTPMKNAPKENTSFSK